MTKTTPGHIEMPGGWCTPADVIPELLTPIRGGMRYPTPKETHTMTDSTPEINLEDLDTLVQMRTQLDALIREKQDAAKRRLIPAAPNSSMGHMFEVGVKYAKGDSAYRYLLYRVPGKGWYTTGQGEAGFFETWRELVEWLRRPDVYWHSPLVRLVKGNSTIMDAEYPNA